MRGVKRSRGQKAVDGPIGVDVIDGQNDAWCSCCLRKNQPFCDNSHKGSEFKPFIYKATETKKMFFCACKQTNDQPFCDGSHNK